MNKMEKIVITLVIVVSGVLLTINFIGVKVNGNQVQEITKQAVTLKEAKEIALRHIGVKEEEVKFKIEKEIMKGNSRVYEIEFEYTPEDYESYSVTPSIRYYVEANSGRIITFFEAWYPPDEVTLDYMFQPREFSEDEIREREEAEEYYQSDEYLQKMKELENDSKLYSLLLRPIGEVEFKKVNINFDEIDSELIGNGEKSLDDIIVEESETHRVVEVREKDLLEYKMLDGTYYGYDRETDTTYEILENEIDKEKYIFENVVQVIGESEPMSNERLLSVREPYRDRIYKKLNINPEDVIEMECHFDDPMEGKLSVTTFYYEGREYSYMENERTHEITKMYEREFNGFPVVFFWDDLWHVNVNNDGVIIK